MARLRYLQNARTGTAGTISKDTKPIQFYDDDMYIYASADGVLEIVSDTTLTLTAPTINIASSTVSAFTNPVSIGTDAVPITITSDDHQLLVHTTAVGTTTGWFNAVEFDTEITAGGTMSSTAQVVGVQAFVRIPTGTTWTSTGGMSALSGAYMGVGTNTVSAGVHSGIGGMLIIGADYTLTGAELAVCVLGNQVNASADIEAGRFSGLLIKTLGAYEEYDQAIKIEATCDVGIDLTDYCTTGIDIGTCTTGILITNASTYAIQIVTDGKFVMGTTSVGIPVATGEHAMQVHTQPEGAFTAYTSNFGIRSRYHISLAQTNMTTINAIDARLRVKHGLKDGIHTALQATIEADTTNADFTGTVTTTMNAAGSFTLDFSSDVTCANDIWMCGVSIDSAVSDSVSMTSAEFVALRISTGTSSKKVWEYGIYMGDDDAVVGMQIGDCTTGIVLDGDMTTGISIGLTGTPLPLTSATRPLHIFGDVESTVTSGAHCSQLVETAVLTSANITTTAQVFGILSQLNVEGTTTLSAGGFNTAIGAYFITGGTTTASNSICSAMSAVMYAGADFTVSSTGIYCGLAVTDFTHATAVTNNDDGLVAGIFIANQGGTTLPNAIKIGGNVTNFVRFIDDSIIASVSGGTNDGWFRVNIGGYVRYIRTYDAK